MAQHFQSLQTGTANSINTQNQMGCRFPAKINKDVSERPPYTYKALIFMAIQGIKERMLTFHEICSWIELNFSYYKNNENGWRNSVRQNLRYNRCFVKIIEKTDRTGKCNYWTLDLSAGNLMVDASNGRLRRGILTASSHYIMQRQYLPYHPQMRVSPYAVYFYTPQDITAIQQASLYDRFLRDSYHRYQQHQ